MMRPLSIALLCLLIALPALAQEQPQTLDQPFRGEFINREQNVRIVLNLYEATLVHSGYKFLGKTNGYITGNLYDAWFVTTFTIKGNKATVNFSNDLGADTQTAVLTLDDKGCILYECKSDNMLRRAVNRKWVKLPKKMVFEPIGRRP